MADEQGSGEAIELATELTIAWLSNPNTRAQANEVPDFLRAMHDAVAALRQPDDGQEEEEVATPATPAVTVRKSLASPEHIVSMIDGKPYKSLKRHLSRHGMTPQQYREKFGLKGDYPMVAPAYAEKRRELAKSIGLGRRVGEKAQPASAAKTRRPRKLKTTTQVD